MSVTTALANVSSNDSFVPDAPNAPPAAVPHALPTGHTNHPLVQGQRDAQSPSQVLAAGRAAAGRLFSGIPIFNRGRVQARGADDTGADMVTIRNTLANSRNINSIHFVESADDASPLHIPERSAAIHWHPSLTSEGGRHNSGSGPIKSILRQRVHAGVEEAVASLQPQTVLVIQRRNNSAMFGNPLFSI